MYVCFGAPCGAPQVKVLELLGALGGASKGVIGGVDTHMARSLSWDTVSRLGYGFPLALERVDVHLDPLFPVVLDLAETSSNRQTKVPGVCVRGRLCPPPFPSPLTHTPTPHPTCSPPGPSPPSYVRGWPVGLFCALQVLACELLHALIVYLVGSAAHTGSKVAGTKHGEQLTPILRKVRRFARPFAMRVCPVPRVCVWCCWVSTRTARVGCRPARGSVVPLHQTELRPRVCVHACCVLLAPSGPVGQVYPGVLRLATDMEKVARQLFEPLALQLVRLYSTDIAGLDDATSVSSGRR